MERLSLTGKRWMMSDCAPRTHSLAETLLQRRGIDALGAGEILEQFGHDARHFRDFEKAATRIRDAIASGETIGVFGDYDCDGITSTSLLVRFLRRRGVQPVVRLPHRLNEGYGLTSSRIEEFRKAGVTLLITVDTGVTALEPITQAKDAGIDAIILDHHCPAEILPPAHAILHPELTTPPLDSSPCGAGIAWSLVSALEEMDGKTDWEDRGTDIALAAIGTIADIVELRGGNRTLTHSGLLALAQLREGPLALLCMQAGLQGPYSSRDIAFRLAPRINAAGRMADPHIALHALLGDASALLELDTLNRDRQDVVAAHLEDLLPRGEMETAGFLCFVHEDYSPGICGLLAGKLSEAYGKPSLVAALVGDVCTASLRSVPGYDMTAGLARCAELLLNFGGHAMAAGCTFPYDAFQALQKHLNDDVSEYVDPSNLIPTLTVECALTIEHVTANLCDSLNVLEPFGQGNPEPRFVIESVCMENVRCVGKGGKHLQATVRGRKLIGFNLGHLKEVADQPLDLLCKIGMDAWQGRKSPQLFLDDIRIAEKTQRPKVKTQGNLEKLYF